MNMSELAVEARIQGADRVAIVGERRGNPGIIRVYAPHGDTLANIVSFIVKGVRLGREAGAGYPESPRRLIVETDGSSIADEFADAMVVAFHARVFEEPREDDVVARIEAISERDVRVTFYWRGRLVGPMLKLGKPAVMIKRVAEA